MSKIKFYAIAAIAFVALVVSLAFAQSRVNSSAPTLAPIPIATPIGGELPGVTPVPVGSPPPPFPGGYATADPRGPNGQYPYIPPFKSDADDQTPGPLLMGSPAIRPSIIGAGPDTPSFTAADVTQYSNANNIYGIWGYASSVRPTINKIEFLTDAEVHEQVPSYPTGLVAGTLRVYVQYNGAFFLIAAPQAKPIPCPHAFEIFDAHTGNRIAYGVDPH
jgi:hypothetical protein